jgi:hypothetical protein
VREYATRWVTIDEPPAVAVVATLRPSVTVRAPPGLPRAFSIARHHLRQTGRSLVSKTSRSITWEDASRGARIRLVEDEANEVSLLQNQTEAGDDEEPYAAS